MGSLIHGDSSRDNCQRTLGHGAIPSFFQLAIIHSDQAVDSSVSCRGPIDSGWFYGQDVDMEHFSSHTLSQARYQSEFTNHINLVIENDPDIGHRYPIPTDTTQLFDKCKDGLILCKLINDSVPDTIDMCVLNKPAGRKAPNVLALSGTVSRCPLTSPHHYRPRLSLLSPIMDADFENSLNRARWMSDSAGDEEFWRKVVTSSHLNKIMLMSQVHALVRRPLLASKRCPTSALTPAFVSPHFVRLLNDLKTPRRYITYHLPNRQ
ncbi:hypothetical protein K435DRAFT_864040 [Dendrothele bispora CBS 962.96]|uniref:Calponin-homology (CH) domain-containing protein n=1 Tax=Dendrothele bispora (strain CBS 962.96) TaxID=1314807 RepID=A0A4S8LN81_DENBC|nr:hypothetical protein K435DRAFT_864040 [Dendrothele bispora CBS 962.96]